MNYCIKCQSIYAQPGTCNCYAEKSLPQRDISPLPYSPPTFPFYPWGPNAVPYIGTPYWRVDTTTPTWTIMNNAYPSS